MTFIILLSFGQTTAAIITYHLVTSKPDCTLSSENLGNNQCHMTTRYEYFIFHIKKTRIALRTVAHSRVTTACAVL